MEILELCYRDNYETFDKWFHLIKMNKEVYPKFRIPYQEWLDEYIENIESKNEGEVLELLRHLLSPFTRETDMSDYEYANLCYENIKKGSMPKEYEEINKGRLRSFIKVEKYRRLHNGQDAWEGLTWILQFLPHSPYKAIKALDSYLSAEEAYMPDDRIIGINQCISIIEAKFIYSNNDGEKYLKHFLNPREFELLIGSLYESLGYEVEVTPATRDGGKDIIARIDREDGKEVVYVECKLYKTTKLTIKDVAYFALAIRDNKINRGVLFCTGYVNQKLREVDSRIQIWTLEDIIVLLNAHLGSEWYKRLSLLIENQRHKNK